jgi:crossover junction endodeoxyribonuclease RuvC
VIFVGVDPGKNGAVAAVDSSGTIIGISRFVHAETEGRIALVILDFVAELDPDEIKAATIERVGAMPRQGVVSMFTFGRVYGEAWAGLLASQCRTFAVTPSTWQRDLLLPKRDCVTNHKRALKQEAETRFGRSLLLAEADAVWLAEWGRLHGPWSAKVRGVQL